jgi:hypothetical protein
LTAAGECTLRAAVEQANFKTNQPLVSEDVTINLPGGAFNLNGPLLFETTSTLGRTIRVNGLRGRTNTVLRQTQAGASVISVQARTKLKLSDLTIREGNAAFGGGIQMSGISDVELTRVIVRNNQAANAGGGIYMPALAGSTTQPQLKLTDSEVMNNQVTSPGGTGGGIYTEATNLPGNGVALTTLTMLNSTVSENSAGQTGGLHCGGICNLTNSTVSGNAGNSAAGAWIGPQSNSQWVNVTVANNHSITNPSTATQLSFNGVNGNALSLRNVILQAPADGTINCAGPGPAVEFGHNLSSDGSCATKLTNASTLHNTNAVLDALDYPFYVANTRVHQLLNTSPAINAGAFQAGDSQFDQLNHIRVAGTAQDIGAVEHDSLFLAMTSGQPPASIPATVPFTFTFSALSNPAPTFSTAAPLPAWLTLNPTTGVLSGTPPAAAAGTTLAPITVNATVVRPLGAPLTVGVTFTLNIDGVAPAFTGGTQPHNIVAGQTFTFILTASGAPAPVFGINGAPAWVTLEDGERVTGTAPVNLAGTTVPITVTATNGTGTIQATIDLIISAAPAAPQFTTVANGETISVGQVYSKTFIATGTPTPTLSTPNRPDWLNFNPASGVLSGSTQFAGDYPVTITATNTAGTVSQSFIISVKPLIVIQPPEKPVGLTCAGAGQSITCSLPMSSDADNYMLTCTNGATLAEARVLGPESPFVLSGLVRGSTYACRVVAYNAGGASPASDAVTITLPDAAPAWRPTTVDINGDAAPDVLVSGNGNVLRGSFDGHRLNFVPLAFLSNNIRVLGAGDFNGEHRADVLFRDLATGDVKLWRADAVNPPKGSGETGTERFVRNVKDGWSVEAIADIDGDGRNDIVWRYVTPNTPDSGVVYVWYMADNVVTEVRSRGGAPLTWDLVGAADLNGDGMAELVWVSPANEIRSLTAKSQKAFVNEKIGTVPSGFKLMRAADFNGDGKADFLFGDTNGNLRLWTMNGLTRQAEIQLPAADPTWELYAIVDLNGDGAMDIVWKQPDGRLQAWFMNTQNLAAPIMLNYAGDAPQGTQSVNP